MVTRTCGHCGERSHLTPRWHKYFQQPDGDQIGHVAYTCDVCGSPTMAAALNPNTSADVDRAAFLVEEAEAVWVPTAAVGKDYPDAPEQIASTADEAYRSASIGARRGAILLARTAIEATAKDQGVEKGNLASKIDALAEQSLIRPNIARAAHRVRLAGNDMAHGDIGTEVNDADVQQMLRLMDVVLREVYETPALIDGVSA